MNELRVKLRTIFGKSMGSTSFERYCPKPTTNSKNSFALDNRATEVRAAPWDVEENVEREREKLCRRSWQELTWTAHDRMDWKRFAKTTCALAAPLNQ